MFEAILDWLYTWPDWVRIVVRIWAIVNLAAIGGIIGYQIREDQLERRN